MAQQYSLGNANLAGGKAFRIFIALKVYAHCIYLLLTVSLIMIPHGKRHSALGFPVKLNFAGRERVKIFIIVQLTILASCAAVTTVAVSFFLLDGTNMTSSRF